MNSHDQVISVETGDERLYTHVLFEGAATPTPVLVDTGSSELALCPGSDVGSAEPLDAYAACYYGDGSYGWVGQWHRGTATFGLDASESVTDPKPVLAALIDDQNADLCGPLQGILGVDFGGNQIYNEPQSLGHGAQAAAGTTGKGSFADTMLNPGDAYTMAFVGVTPDNSGQARIAFGAAAEELLGADRLAGSTSILKGVQWWYTLTTPMAVAVLDGDESVIAHAEYDAPSPEANPIIDSGTPTLVLPPDVVSAINEAGYDVGQLPEDATIVIELPGVTLELPVSKLPPYSVQQGQPIEAGDQPILGFPVFWVYDVKFQTQDEVLSFYHRQ